ncbi:hypothetical protein DH2020_005494 [Rehmannia glutinosa]|uniref:Exostosin GT47 domain-containing protein n=1 Tax=Rehmannia glutinosa TaxID=99300 RepID=A0ABR0XGA8_REHGL
MAVSVSRKKTRLSKKIQADNELGFVCSFFEKILFRVPAAIFVLVFIYVWSSSTAIFSGNVVHVCVSSRKLNNLYCLSAGTQPNFEIPVSVVKNSSSNGEEIKQVADFGIKIDVPIANDSSTSRINGNAIISSGKMATKLWKTLTGKSRNSYKRSVLDLKFEPRDIMRGKRDLRLRIAIEVQQRLALPMRRNDPVDSSKNDASVGRAREKLGRGWHHTHQYSLEPIFHARVLNHPCRVYDPNFARMFYVPYYGGLDVLRWHFKNVSNDVKDSLGLDLIRWLESQGPWYKNLGKDHVFVLGKNSWDFRRNDKSSWGTRLLELDEMQNPIKLLIERQPWVRKATSGYLIRRISILGQTMMSWSWRLKVLKSNREAFVTLVRLGFDSIHLDKDHPVGTNRPMRLD